MAHQQRVCHLLNSHPRDEGANRSLGRTANFKRVVLSPNMFPPPSHSTIAASSAVPQVDGPVTTAAAATPSQLYSQPLQITDHNTEQFPPCLACGNPHRVGYCPLKLAGVEHCGLCGIAHYGHQRTCPHLGSITQCRAMLNALKHSPESHAEIEAAKKYIVGVIGDLQRRKKLKENKDGLQSGQRTSTIEHAHGPHANKHQSLQDLSNPQTFESSSK